MPGKKWKMTKISNQSIYFLLKFINYTKTIDSCSIRSYYLYWKGFFKTISLHPPIVCYTFTIYNCFLSLIKNKSHPIELLDAYIFIQFRKNGILEMDFQRRKLSWMRLFPCWIFITPTPSFHERKHQFQVLNLAWQ